MRRQKVFKNVDSKIDALDGLIDKHKKMDHGKRVSRMARRELAVAELLKEEETIHEKE